MNRAKILATLGPATDNDETIGSLIEAGAGLFRLNFSHGSHEQHQETIGRIRRVSMEMGAPVAVLQDLQGPKIRVGNLPDEGVELVDGAPVRIGLDPDTPGSAEGFGTTYPRFVEDVNPGDPILLADGLIRLRAVNKTGGTVEAVVEEGGRLFSHKGINLPGSSISAPSMTQKDLEDLEFGIQWGVDLVALSFVRTARDMADLKKRLAGTGILAVAKLERPEAMENLEEIVAVADGVMVARGDLGVEMGPEEVPVLQKRILTTCAAAGVPVITATQMLESMTEHSRPTRAEASDVANAVWGGSDVLMLSQETATGKYPLETVAMMRSIIEKAEANQPETPERRRRPEHCTVAGIIGYSATGAAEDLPAAAVAVFTRSGFSARLISRYRPRVPILAFTSHEKVYRQLSLLWGVTPVLINREVPLAEMPELIGATCRKRGLGKPGDPVVIVSGSFSEPGSTSMLRFHTLS